MTELLELFVPLLKTLGICVVSKTCGDVCRDVGQSAMAWLIELAGTVAALLCAVPLLQAVWDMLTVTAYALPPELLDALPGQARELLEEAEAPTVQETARGALALLGRRGRELLTDALSAGLGPTVRVLGAVILCAVAESVYRGADSAATPNFVPCVGVLTVTAATAGSMETMVGLGYETVEELYIFSQALIPTLAAALSASGGMVSASVRQVATVWVSGALISLVRHLLMPLIYCYIAVSAAQTMAPQSRLKGLSEAIRKAMTWLLSGSLMLFTGYLALSGAVAESADGLTATLARSAISTAVPVVGGILSEASASVLAGATLLKNTVGVGGMLGVLAVCLAPFFTLGAQYLLFLLAAFFADLLGTTLSDYVHALSKAFGLILGMVGACALVLLVSITSSVSVVIV